MIAFDTNILWLCLDPNKKSPTDPKTQKPVEKVAERVAYLVECIKDIKETIIIPTPVLSEIAAGAGTTMSSYLDFLDEKQSVFKIVPFYRDAALKAGEVFGKNQRLKRKNTTTTRQTIKFDMQIVAIAKVEGAHAIYSEDQDIHKYARQFDLQAYRTADLPLP